MRVRAAAAAVLLAAVFASASRPALSPAVWLVKASPVTVAGSGFAAGRSVSVSYRSGAVTRHLVARADPRGRLRVTIGHVAFQRCKGATVAAGSAELVVLPCSTARPELTAGWSGMVRGLAFLPRERVTVTGRLSGEAPVAESVTADADGRFALRLPLSGAVCAERFYRAVGSLGSTASATPPAPACKPL